MEIHRSVHLDRVEENNQGDDDGGGEMKVMHVTGRERESEMTGKQTYLP